MPTSTIYKVNTEVISPHSELQTQRGPGERPGCTWVSAGVRGTGLLLEEAAHTGAPGGSTWS